MSAARDAVVLPLLFLTVTLFGGLEPGAAARWSGPSLFSLVLALMTVGLLARSGTLRTDALLHASRSGLANLNGLVALLALYAASAQVMHMLTPRSGLPSVFVGLVLFLLLVNTWASGPDRVRVVRSLAVALASAFLLKFVVLAALADPEGSRTARVFAALFDLATLGTIAQDPLHPAAGYIAFFVVIGFLAGVALLPAGVTALEALERRRPSLPEIEG